MSSAAIPAPTETLTGKAARRVFLVDDHPIFRHGLAAVIDAEPDLEVTGQAASAAQALELLRRIEVDVAVIDVSLSGTNGLELLKHLRAEHPKLPLLMLSAHDEQVYAMRCLRAGASGYLMKSGNEQKMIAALRKVLEGGIYVSPIFGEQLIYKVARSEGTGSDSPLDVLSDRELEVLQHVGSGHSSRDIGDRLHLSIKTVESHRLHIKEKLGFADAGKLLRFATDWVAQQEGS